MVFEMENSAQRRLHCVCRHLLPPLEPNAQLLIPVRLRDHDSDYGEGEAVVVGGMVLDIHATPAIPPSSRTTTPGEVHFRLGGVARNVAECISKLGAKPYLISALGTDIAGKLLLQPWESAGLSTQGIRKHQDIQTPVICNIFDTDGELAAAVARVDAIEKFLTADWIHLSVSYIRSSPIVMVDANLTPSALAACCEVAAKFDTPVWFEPVSVAKSRRIVSVVQHISIVSPNEDELIAMANALSGGEVLSPPERNDSNATSTDSLFSVCKRAASVLLEKGIKIVAVTLGAHGVLLCSRGSKSMKFRLDRTRRCINEQFYNIVAATCPSSRSSVSVPFQSKRSLDLFAAHFPALPASVIKLTGAGDCFVGGTLASLCAGLDLMQSVAIGIAAAKAAVESDTNVPATFMLDAIAESCDWSEDEAGTELIRLIRSQISDDFPG